MKCISNVGISLGGFLLSNSWKGQDCTITTNHSTLKFILNIASATERLAYWRLRSSDFAFEVVFQTALEKKLLRYYSDYGKIEWTSPT